MSKRPWSSSTYSLELIETALPISMDHIVSSEIIGYLGRERVEQDEVSLPLCRRLAALLNISPASLSRGDALPVGWSAVLFPEISLQSELAEDGHPRKGEFLPPVALPRRRFAGRNVRIYRPLFIGEIVERRSIIDSITPKLGRNGEMVFVGIRHEIAGAAGPAYTESQNVVYLGNTDADQNQKGQPLALPQPVWQEYFTPDTVALFRYSALTFNGHRIHYDMPYAAQKEGYKALVMNGGLTTLRLLELARKCLGETIVKYDVRAIRPLFEGGQVTLCGGPTADGAVFWAVDECQQLAMKIDMRTV